MIRKSFSLLAVITALCLCVASCAGGASGSGGAGAENASLAVQIPAAGAGRAVWAESDLQVFTVTIASDEYMNSKTAGAGETVIFSDVPIGTYHITIIAKKNSGEVTAKGEATATVSSGSVSSVTVMMSPLVYHTVSYYESSDDNIPYLTQRVTAGYTATRPDDPEREEETFIGWWTSSDDGETFSSEWNFDNEVNEDVVLYARFEESVVIVPATTFVGTVAQFSTLDFNIDGKGSESNPCSVTVTGITGGSPASDLSAITAKLTEYRIGDDPGVYCTLDLSNCNFTTVTSGAFECAGSDTVGNRGIVGITLPDTVTLIGSSAFYDSHVTSITLPSSLTTIMEYAFCYSKFTSVTIPDNVSTIWITSFMDSNSLETFTAPGTWVLRDGDGNPVVSGITLDAAKMKNPANALTGFSPTNPDHCRYYYSKEE